jgi:multicomponent Na+:H+ antiporter subunit D
LKSRAESRFGEASENARAGVFARAWTIGTTALWIAVLLTAYVLFYIV